MQGAVPCQHFDGMLLRYAIRNVYSDGHEGCPQGREPETDRRVNPRADQQRSFGESRIR